MDIPLTPPGTSWSQREYIACLHADIGFASHGTRDGYGSYFHYNLGDRCVTLKIKAEQIVERIDHQFTPNLNWIEHCRMAMMRKER